ncbi:MAG: hypothetical protein JXR96_13875 [Deltaproteobacteria bacterium]|nr:hypothetical protein [Deltaproteobacteria bacterium]
MQHLSVSAVLAIFIAGACHHAGNEPSPPPPGKKAAENAPQKKEAEKKDCRAHAECPSGVCSHCKKDYGHCAPVDCRPGERADNNHFFCSKEGKWEKSRTEGAGCDQSYQCYQPTCFMDPMCDLRPKVQAVCEKGKCVHKGAPDSCAVQGKKRVLHPSEYMIDDEGRCMESLAQRVLRTVCVPCGNGTCDPDESHCNCPADCPAP